MGLRVRRHGIPESLAEVYPEHYWSTRKLWALKLPVRELALGELDWILRLPVWYLDPHPVPEALMRDPALDAGHWERVLKADLRWPVHVVRLRSRLVVLDGIHRLVKAKREGLSTVPACVLGESELASILPEPTDFESGFLKQALARRECVAGGAQIPVV